MTTRTDDDVRAELRELVRAAQAHVEWLRDSGLDEVRGAMPTAHAAKVVSGRARPAGLEASVVEASVVAPVREAPSPRPRVEAADPSPLVDARPMATGGGATLAPRPVLSSLERRRQLEVLASEVASCTRCPLHATRTRTAFARGNPDAELVFVGEGPGTQEDLQGEPFVGPAGQLLDKMIAAMGFSPDEVYILNVVKCRPSEAENPKKDRKPEAEEMAACRPFFDRQLELLEPKVMVALGATAVQGLTGSTTGITRLRGTWRLYKGRIPLMPTFHPAYLLRSPEKKREVWDDLQQVMQRLGKDPSKKSR